MPELPEVETTRRGLLPVVTGRRIERLWVRDYRLRWPIDPGLPARLAGLTILTIDRRAKYLLLRLSQGSLIVHLGMSGSLRIVTTATAPGPWDPYDLILADGIILRLRDPRRFGALLWTLTPAHHPLLAAIGPEPLASAFDGQYLYARSRGRRVAIRDFLLNSHIVAGIGNIYAHEALFAAGIHPTRAAGGISRGRYERLAQALIAVLKQAIAVGGTTLRDFAASDGRPGYFQQQLHVYGRGGKPCHQCQRPIRRQTVSGRGSYFCPHCQR
ncbi:MAG: bifunctional DNA-formamidopyrimidine glycosylase/DNA-(apurinic or apyrimidinic site) lyase [Acidiferrobacter sp.]